jgi:methionine-rich copper-binding protein CopC
MSTMLRCALIGAVLFALLPLAVANAHAELTSASPGPDGSVSEVPARLVARFSQDIAADRTSIEVRDATGATVARGGKDPDRARVQLVDLPPLEPGTYEVRWVTFSTEDDEIARGRYSFTVTVPVTTPGPTMPVGASCPSPEPAPAASTLPGASADPVVSAEPVASTVPAASAGSDGSAMPSASALPSASSEPCVSPSASATPAPASSSEASPMP